MKYRTPLMTALVAVAMATALCGCPNNAGNLTCWLWNTDETGVQTATPVGNFSGIDAPAGGPYFHFEGGKADASESWVDYQVVGRDEPVRLNLINPNNDKSEDGVEKCSTCTAHVVVGLVAIMGYTVPAIVDAVESASEQWFDVVVPMGPVVETATLQVTTTRGDQFVIVMYGEASGITPPAEDDYRLTVKVQGQGSVAIDGVDDEVTSSAVFDVNANTDVYFTAQPDNGWRFEKWLVNGSSEGTTPNAEAMVTMESDVEVIAVFVEESAPADTIAPVITLNGSNPVNLTVGATWTDPGATAVDAVDGICNVSVSGTVNTGAAGTYTITYSAADRSGNQATATRTVVVENGTQVNGLAINLGWSGSDLSFSAVGAIPNGKIGLELYYVDLATGPFTVRTVFNVDANGNANGTIPFRAGAKILRFSVVKADTGEFIPHEEVAPKWNGVTIGQVWRDHDENPATPMVDAFEVTIR